MKNDYGKIIGFQNVESETIFACNNKHKVYL